MRARNGRQRASCLPPPGRCRRPLPGPAGSWAASSVRAAPLSAGASEAQPGAAERAGDLGGRGDWVRPAAPPRSSRVSEAVDASGGAAGGVGGAGGSCPGPALPLRTYRVPALPGSSRSAARAAAEEQGGWELNRERELRKKERRGKGSIASSWRMETGPLPRAAPRPIISASGRSEGLPRTGATAEAENPAGLTHTRGGSGPDLAARPGELPPPPAPPAPHVSVPLA